MKVEKVFEEVEDSVYKVKKIEPLKFHLTYQFNVGHAQLFGLDEAIMLNNMIFWIEKNKANGRNYHDDHFWTFNSSRAFQELFPFWSQDHIKRLLRKMEEKGVIMSGVYNDLPYDRTKWYTLTNETLGQICPMEGKKVPNERDEIAPPIPDIKPDFKTDNKDILSGKPDAPPDFIKQVIDYLNQKTGKSFKSSTPKNRNLIKARVMETATFEDFKQVIDIKAGQWLNDPKMAQYLRPETLLGTKFESYLNERPGSSKYKYNPGDRF
jgi:uncharacterized phage protein (TIGR02220 family)